MNPIGGTAAPPRTRGTYFFLSYAHSALILQQPQPDAAAGVRQFFEDLSFAVSHHARPGAPMRAGFFDQLVPLGSDWKAVLTEALSTAEVFVPLYSPRYFSNSWSMRELQAFRRRLELSASPNQEQHVLPVLWTPFPSWDETPEVREALRLGEDIPAYAENGMRALRMLGPQDEYDHILNKLADRIVELAERFPLGSSPAPSLDDVPAPTPTATAFVVAVLAPTRASLPPHRSAHTYDKSSVLWRPFHEQQELPAAEYVASTAERLGLPTRVVPFSQAGSLPQRRPAVLLIDPWILATEGGERQLRAAVGDLPAWVVPLVVADRGDPQYVPRGRELTRRTVGMLSAAGVRHLDPVGQVTEFVDALPRLVHEARQQYLSNGPVYPPEGQPTARPRLGKPDA